MIFREVEDRDLIAKARRGHVEAYNVLVSRWEKRVFNYLLRLVGEREDALDLSQDVFLKAYQNLNKLDDPANAAPVVQEIKAVSGMQNYAVRSMAEYLSMMTVTNLPGLAQFIAVVIGVSVVIGFIVIFQAMYTAVMERTREIGILKSLGASRLYIVNVILRETLLLTLAGIAVGVGVSYAARAGIVSKFPTLRVIVPAGWIGWATVIAIIGAILGALYPAIKAARKDPMDALAYE